MKTCFLNHYSIGQRTAGLIALLLMSVGMLAQEPFSGDDNYDFTFGEESVEEYGLTVGNVAVTSENALNIFGGDYPSARYDKVTNTLTLNSCRYFGEVSSFILIDNLMDSLNVRLVGYSEVGGSAACLFNATSDITLNLMTDAAVPGKLVYDGDHVKERTVTLNFGTSGLTLKEGRNSKTIETADEIDGISYFGTAQFHDAEEGSSVYEDYPAWDYTGWYYTDAVVSDENSNLPPSVVSAETADGQISRMRSSGQDRIESLTLQYVPAGINAAMQVTLVDFDDEFGEFNDGTIQYVLAEFFAPVQVALMSLDGETTYAIGTLLDGSVTLTPNAPVTYDDVCLVFTSEQPFSFAPMAVKTVYAEASDMFDIGVTFGDRQWTTYCAPANLQVPEGLKAYIVTGIRDATVLTEEIDYLPQGEGLLLYKSEPAIADIEQYTTFALEDAVGEISNNLLVGTWEAASVPDLMMDHEKIFVLYNDGFTRATRGIIAAGRAYLPIGDNIVDDSAAARLSIVFDDDEMTGIRSQNSCLQSQNLYNLNGQRISRPAKGFYLQNGKKIVKK